jgi:hypothetical protein
MSRSWASIVDLLPDEPSHILISAEAYSEEKNTIPRLYKLNIYTGAINFIVEAPLADSNVFVNSLGNVSLAIGINEKNKKVVFEYNKTKNNWQEILQFEHGTSFVPLIFDDN